MAGKKRIVTIKLTRKEAEALINAGNRGVADLIDCDTEEDSDIAQTADDVLTMICLAVDRAWPTEIPS